jgi:hypothetical protein
MTATLDTDAVAAPGPAVLQAVALLEAGADQLAAAVQEGALWDLPAAVLAEVSARLRGVSDRTDAARMAVLPVLESDGRWAVDGSRSFAHWLARTENVALPTARAGGTHGHHLARRAPGDGHLRPRR